MNVFISNFNLLTYPKQMVEVLSDFGLDVIFVDNKSTYLPLLEWYNNCPYKVFLLDYNYREVQSFEPIRHSPWASGIIESYNERFYIVTDPDLDLSGVPSDMADKLLEGVSKSDTFKCGLSLRIDDLPDNDIANRAREHESAFYAEKNEHGFYKAQTATTLAVYDAEKYRGDFLNAVRAPEPYTARHIPYYLTMQNISDEYLYYIKHSKWAGWDKLIS